MTSAPERIAPKLQAALGASCVRREPGSSCSDGEDGSATALVCAPTTQEGVGTILRLCAEAKTPVSPRGGGTGTNVGNATPEACVIIDSTRLNRVIDHDPANLTVTAESGITLSALNKSLAAHRQFLPMDVPHPTRASLGGTIALNLNGPRRGFYGGVRDLVIGLRVALATGEQIKAGGKVVKNVAGYDMCKLFTGSMGTLGVITEATVRVAPVPESAASMLVSGTFKPVMEFADLLSQSQLLPAAVVLMSSQEPHEWQVGVRCEGPAEHVARHLSDGEAMAQRLGLGTEILRDDAVEKVWSKICDFPLEAGRCVFRATLPRASLGNFTQSLNGMTGSAPVIISDMLIGTVWLSWPAENELVELFPQLISLAAAHRGHAVLFAAPSRLKGAMDVWGPPPASYSLMRKIKQQFDPNGLLNPGRFVGGI
jgi:glycolate oxidase FAD binding subunit